MTVIQLKIVSVGFETLRNAHGRLVFFFTNSLYTAIIHPIYKGILHTADVTVEEKLSGGNDWPQIA